MLSILDEYIQNIRKYDRLTEDDTNKLFDEYIKKGRTDHKIEDKISCANLRLVVSRAMKYNNEQYNEQDIMDFIQQGNIALLHAIKGYDNDGKTKFSTYATTAIDNNISRYITENNKTIRIPNSKNKEVKKVDKAISELKQKTQHEYVTNDEVAEYLGWKISKVVELRRISQLNTFFSLDGNAYKDDEDGITIQGTIADPNNEIEKIDYELSNNKPKYDIYCGDDTLKIKEMFQDYFKETKCLIKDALPIDIYKGIGEISPRFALNRLICTLYPESEFAKIADGNFNRKFNKNEIKKRNILIENAINEFIPQQCHDEFSWFPNYSCKIYDAIRREDRAESNKREKCFLIALAFNLEFQQFEEFMTHSIGERRVDFKNPYEVLASYCICSHVNVCEKYIRLKEIYEHKKKMAKQNTVFKSTSQYENAFWKIETEDDLIEFLLTLPEKNSESANKVFAINYEFVKQIVENKISDFEIDEIDFEHFHKRAIELCNKSNTNEKFFRELRVSTDVINDILGADKEGKSQKISKDLKSNIFTMKQCRDFLQGNDTPNKEQLLVLIFYRYCISNARENVLRGIKGTDGFVEKIYNHFEQFTYEDLEMAGFDNLHILDNFERFLFFCILTEEPLKTFQMILTEKD